jgi:8-oxo-dGTP diphosphatase
MVAKLLHVAVGVIVNADGKILIAKRPLSAHQGGLWEFPGGKVDAGETIERALVRELHEELAIDVLASQPLIQIRHHYPDKSVLLDVHKITQFLGTPIGNEGQPIQWVDAKELNNFAFPAANRPIISAINLPEKYAITGAYLNSVDFMVRLNRVLAMDLRIVQFRVADFCVNTHKSLLDEAIQAVNQSNGRLVINSSLTEFDLLTHSLPDKKLGLHLNHHHAAAINARPVGQEVLFGISCHNAEEITHAQNIGADYLLLSPVLPTDSHPSAKLLGWESFSALAELANIPVYALGGVGEEHIKTAQSCGAQGVAGISAWW